MGSQKIACRAPRGVDGNERRFLTGGTTVELS